MRERIKKLLDRVRETIRRRHYSTRTERLIKGERKPYFMYKSREEGKEMMTDKAHHYAFLLLLVQGQATTPNYFLFLRDAVCY